MSRRYTADIPLGRKTTTSLAELNNTTIFRLSKVSDHFDVFFEKCQDSVAEWSKALV